VDREAKLAELMFIVSRDVANFRTDKDCKQKCISTIAMVSSRKKIEAVCLHEAGHFAESVKLGLMVGFKESDIEFLPPRVIHLPENTGASRFQENPGSIFTPFKAQEITWTLPILQQAARVAVAGGVYAHKLANRPVTEGTGGDWNLYTTYYRIALPTLHAHPDLLVATKLWDWAEVEVQSDLEKHAELEAKARKKAAQFTQDHYRPFLEFCDLIH
jgi:hypothetical protein